LRLDRLSESRCCDKQAGSHQRGRKLPGVHLALQVGVIGLRPYDSGHGYKSGVAWRKNLFNMPELF
jgi:hypothetical protein